MSGHSKWSTIKRKKETTDIARGKVFSKHSKAIAVSVKQGGGKVPSTNYKLRIAIDQAKSDNMPKSNIDKAINRGDSAADYDEVIYEGFGPEGVNIMVVAATDNKNRTAQEMKSLFDKRGGRLAGPGAVSFNFESKGMLLIEKASDVDEQTLKLIDLGVEDYEITDDGIEAYIDPSNVGNLKDKLEETGYKLITVELVNNPKSFQNINDKGVAERILKLLQAINDHEDVQKVYANADIDDEILKSIS